MKKSLLLLTCILTISYSQAQQELNVNTLKVDINNNGKIDILKPSTNCIKLIIDNKNYSISYELLGFEKLSDLSYKNNVLTISGFNDGTGGYEWTYKFRNNKSTKMIELIGYDDFNKWVSGNITTSINTITNKYIVLLEEFNVDKQDMETTKYTGNISIRKIGLTDIKQEDVNKLKGIGMKYWK